MKRILSLICAICVLCGLSLSVYATVPDPISPLWENTRNVECTISFTGTNGNIITLVRGNTGTTSIVGTLKLYQDGVEIDTWNINGRSIASISDSFTGISGSTYKLVLDVDVTRNGFVENVEVEDTAKCP